MGDNGKGAGSRLEKGLGIHGGGGRGFGYYLPQGWVSSPAASPALCMVREAAPAWGGYSPSSWQGPVVPGQARSWEPTDDLSCGSLLEPLALPLALPLNPGLRICSARVNTVPWGRGAAGYPVWWAAGTPGSKADWQPCLLSASVAISPAELAVTPAHGLIRIRVKQRVCS